MPNDYGIYPELTNEDILKIKKATLIIRRKHLLPGERYYIMKHTDIDMSKSLGDMVMCDIDHQPIQYLAIESDIGLRAVNIKTGRVVTCDAERPVWIAGDHVAAGRLQEMFGVSIHW